MPDFELVVTADPRPALHAWSDGYVPFEPRREAETALREALRERLPALVAGDGEVLLARYAGPKSPATDIENVLLYNIAAAGAFQPAAATGLRFEYDRGAVPPAPSGRTWKAFFEYRLAPRAGEFACWRATRMLAGWRGAILGARLSEKKLLQTWLAVHRSPVIVTEQPREPSRDFAVELRLRPPAGARFRTAGLVKELIDGVVCSLQAHRDSETLGEVAQRVAAATGISSAEATAFLTRAERAVLGSVARLLHPRGKGVQWRPADEHCVAGSLLVEPRAGNRWELDGSVVEVTPARPASAPR